LVRLKERIPERDVERIERCNRLIADTALGGVDNPAERDFIVWIGKYPEIGEKVADLFPLVEADAPDDLVWNRITHEDFFEGARLVVGPVEDCGVARL